MADPSVAGSTSATDTDYPLEAMVQAFIGRADASANSFTATRASALEESTKDFIRIGQLANEWLSSVVQTMPSIIGAAQQLISSSTADSILNFILFGGRLANSPNPSVPSAAPYYPYGPGGQGAGGMPTSPQGGGQWVFIPTPQGGATTAKTG